ncbi:MAG: S-layer homology domain-containing protein [Anaerolineales bacterium]|nr:S-layer homology domain-containing protein [Anaerolineales bacterium]
MLRPAFGGFIDTGQHHECLLGFGFHSPFVRPHGPMLPLARTTPPPVIEAYGLGIADGTSETTFSPDQPVTRGEFAKMLYRALSRL